MSTSHLNELLRLLPVLRRTPREHPWPSYGPEADVLYVHFKNPAHATDRELTDDDVIVRYEGDEVIGYTLLHASKRN